jgi:hypothetical protein
MYDAVRMKVGDPSARAARRARLLLLVALAVAVAASALAPAQAHAALGIASLTAAPADTTAGAHSDFRLTIGLSGASDDLRNLRIDLPPGLIGNPQATPRCTRAQLMADACPAASQVGSTRVTAAALGLQIVSPGTVYNVEPNPGDPAKLGIVVRPIGGLLGKFMLESPISVRDAGDYGLTSTLTDMPRSLNGIPIDVRAIDLTLSGSVAGGGAFMTNPTRCTPATTTVTVQSYGGATARAQAAFTATGCEGVPFSPAMELTPHDPRTDMNSAFTIGVRLPGDEGGRAQAHLRHATVTLPRGVGLNPPVADGLVLCTDAQFMAENDLPVRCPASSDIGDVVFETPVLAPLRGDVYFGTAPGDPYRLLIVAQDGNLRVKIKASVRLDDETGQITTVFRDLPQFPITRFALTFRGGERSVLATPPTCGRYTGTEAILPWSDGVTRRPAASFDISHDGAGGCDQPVTPQVAATPSTRRAGAETGVRLEIVRPPRTKPVRTLTTVLPKGLLGRIYDVPFCPVAQANRGTCPASSRVGSVAVDVGSGPRTSPLRGDLYLAAPAGDGALARLAFAIPSKVGPIDLGMFTMLAPIRLGERDGRVTVTAALPEAFKGVRLAIRRIALDLDRKGFMVNPTGCTGRAVDEVLGATDGTAGAASAAFAVSDCGALPFAPSIRVLGEDASPRGRSRRPPLTVDVRPRGSDTALKDVVVVFPRDLQPNIDLLRTVCNSPAVDAGRCPEAARIGTARATSPLLPYALEGPVYLTFPEQPDAVSGAGLKLPSTTAVLQGAGGPARIRIDGRLALRDGRLEGRFLDLPDVPLTSFRLALKGGALVATKSPCARDFARGPARLFGHSGARRAADLKIAFAACRRAPLVSVRMRRMRTTRPTIRVEVRRGPLGGRLRSLRLRLPRQLAVRSTRRGVTVRVGRRTLSRRWWSLSRKTKTLRIRGGLGSRGAPRVTVTLSRGAVRGGAKTRARARRGDLRLRFSLTARDTKKRVTRQAFTAYDEALR